MMDATYNCPQCKNVLDSSASRLVQDSCGHKKCRMCLLEDETRCLLCIAEQNPDKTNVSAADIDNHTAVIRCSGKIKIETYNDVSSTKNDRVSGDAISTFHNNQQVKIEDNTDCTGQSENEATRGKRPYKMLSIPSHISVNNGSTNTYTCTICNKTFQTKLHVKYHIYCVDGKKPYECKTCHKQFVTKSDFEIHCINHHNAKKPFSCSVCSKGFPTSSKLNRHMQSHSAKKPFVCQDCGKGFSRKEYLKIHFLLHKEIKKFMCFECNRGFNNSSNLKKHKLTHSKEKPHMCDQCGKRFRLKWTLTNHRRSHLKERPYVCVHCKKSFILLKELHRHELVHIDTKGFSCNLCDLSFRRKDNMLRHVRTSHPGKSAVPLKKCIRSELLKLKKQIKSLSEQQPLVDNPNAINVITASPACILKPEEPMITKPVSVINAPLKLAFKTSAFKNHYNIHSREYVEPSPQILPETYNPEESLSICQKILTPFDTTIRMVGNRSLNQYKTDISPIKRETDSFDCKPNIIRNIKFKLPLTYTSLDHGIKALEPVRPRNVVHGSATYTEVKTVQPVNAATSVIVNMQQGQQTEMHWRRRLSLNLNSDTRDFNRTD